MPVKEASGQPDQPLDEPMMWMIMIPLMTLALLVATVPLLHLSIRTERERQAELATVPSRGATREEWLRPVDARR